MMTPLELAIKVIEEYDKEDAPMFEGVSGDEGSWNGTNVAVALARYVILLRERLNEK